MNRLKSSILAVLAVALVAGLAVVPAEPAEAQGSAALSISPRKDYTIEPGKGVNDTLVIRNLDRERPLSLSLRTVDFTFDDDGGTPKLLLDEDREPTTWSLRSFMDVPEFVEIEPGQTENIPVSVRIPEGHGAGSYYSAIVYSSGASEGGNVGLSASGVTLVFVTIPGEADEKLTLERLGVYDSEARRYITFNVEMPVRAAYTLKNEGNVAGSPVGSMTLRNMLFGKEKIINDINSNKSLALIGQTRTFETCIMTRSEAVDFNGTRQEATTCADPGLWPGIYKVDLHAFYGQNGNNTQEILGKSYFIYAPWWFIVLLIIVLAFVGYRVWRLVRFIQLKRGGGKKRSKRSRG